MNKTFDEFVSYMWKTYPDDDQLRERTAMLKTYNFFSGQYDKEEVERLKIAEKIRKKIEEKRFGDQK